MFCGLLVVDVVVVLFVVVVVVVEVVAVVVVVIVVVVVVVVAAVVVVAVVVAVVVIFAVVIVLVRVLVDGGKGGSGCDRSGTAASVIAVNTEQNDGTEGNSADFPLRMPIYGTEEASLPSCVSPAILLGLVGSGFSVYAFSQPAW